MVYIHPLLNAYHQNEAEWKCFMAKKVTLAVYVRWSGSNVSVCALSTLTYSDHDDGGSSGVR